MLFSHSMIQRRLYFLLALGITCCGFNVSVAAQTPAVPKTREPFITEDSSIQALDTMETLKLGYDALMKAGYAADKKRDYNTALTYFRQALILRPNDSWANKAINNITTHAFDRYMQAGYKADISKDYQLALEHFKKALEIKPNSFYAQKAIANVSNYLAVNAVNAQEPEKVQQNDQKEDDDSGLLWLVIGILGTIGVSGIVLFYLFQKSQNLDLEPVIKENEPTNPINSSIADDSKTNDQKAQKESEVDVEEEETLVAPPSEPQSEPTTNSLQKTVESQNSQIVLEDTNLPKLDIVPELINDLAKSDRKSRQKTVWELAQRGDSRAMQPLVELMVKVDSQERGLILEAMTQITSRTLKPMNKALMFSLDDDNPRVKQNAIRDLARVYELMNQVTKRLSSVAEDSDEEVQKTATWALKQLNQMPTVPFWQNSNHKVTENNNQDISN
ncbi:MAG: hypothetical protein QNJ18_03085 [Xenococcaceae cyanobacterium MO_167.B52]|nr:hypothetical protein [Xenococcaceae cyanobacterium MO_167.B52]